MAEAIRTRVRASEWSIGAWTEVLEIFCAHLRYLPPRLAFSTAGGLNRGRTKSEPVPYSAADVFAAGYGPPPLSTFLPAALTTLDSRVRSLQQLLLRWFELPVLDDEEEVEDSAPISGADGEEMVDRPEPLPRTVPPSALPEPTDRDRRRAERLIVRLGEAMTSAGFLDSRPPDLLAADLRVASALLRVALREGWLDPAEFFRVTHRIWSALFFAPDDGDCGLQRRYKSATSPEDFAAAMRSPSVIAALAAWVLGVPHNLPTPEHARFALTAALAIARLPWLWDEVDDNEICRELAELLANTDLATGQVAATIDILGERWFHVVQRGHALRRLESVLAGQTPALLCTKVPQGGLNTGDLIWQGRAGFCVVTRPATRTAGTKVSALRLQGTRDESDFLAELTVPMLGLLDERVIPMSDAFGQPARRVLRDFLMELADGFRQGSGQPPPRS